jgi:uncharacterized membrane protein
MLTLLTALKFIHVLAAIAVVGPNITTAIWLRAAGSDRDRLLFAITTIRRIDRQVSIPAFGVLLVTGLLMVWTGGYDLTRGWLLTAIGIYAVIGIAGFTHMGPALRRLRAEVTRDPASAASAAALRTSTRYTLVSLLALIVIVGLMVTKP